VRFSDERQRSATAEQYWLLLVVAVRRLPAARMNDAPRCRDALVASAAAAAAAAAADLIDVNSLTNHECA